MANNNADWLGTIDCHFRNPTPAFSELKGKILKGIYYHPEKAERLFILTDDGGYILYHYQDCCESVSLESISGLTGIYGEEILDAIEYIKSDPKASESGTFSFYYLKTNTQDICFRWYGTSNGYYSETVSLVKIDNLAVPDNKYLLTQDW